MPTTIAAAPLAAALAVFLAGPVAAAVTPEQAATLRTTLTPVGAERAGNRDGSIPPWTGGVTTVDPRYRQGDPRPDLYPDERPLFSITAANYGRYADRLPEGAKALFRAMPDFRMDIYPTHRSAAFPQRVTDSVFANATRAHAAAEGIAYGVAGAAGGIPFPIPQNGTEIVWNHLLAFWGVAREAHVSTYVGASDGAVDLTASYREVTDFPYYYPGATPDSFGGYYFKTRRILDAPAARADEGYVAWQPIDTARDRYVAWRVLAGEHRVRKAPSLSYDTPDADAEGIEALDEYYLFFGGPDRYDFRILGKREMYVPYNNNRMYLQPPRAAIGPAHEVPGALRYELHRVWVVDGTLAAGRHHVVPHRRLYVDEDSWLVLYSDSWDEDGRLWKFGHATVDVLPDVPTVIVGTQFVYDLLLGGYVADFVLAGAHPQYRVTPPHDASVFSPQALAAGSER
jgi:hypothetical protein